MINLTLLAPRSTLLVNMQVTAQGAILACKNGNVNKISPEQDFV